MPQPSTQKEEEENKENREEGVPAWPHVAWAEFGLAVAVVGYYFFSLVLLHQSINFQVN